MISVEQARRIRENYPNEEAREENDVVAWEINKKGYGVLYFKKIRKDIAEAWVTDWKPVWEGLGFTVEHNSYRLGEVFIIYPPEMSEDSQILEYSERKFLKEGKRVLTAVITFAILLLLVLLVASMA
jgi:hypothetical protein